MRKLYRFFIYLLLIIFTCSVSSAETNRPFLSFEEKIKILKNNKNLSLKQKLKIYFILKNKKKKLEEKKSLEEMILGVKKFVKIKKIKIEEKQKFSIIKNNEINSKILIKYNIIDLPKPIREGSKFYDKPFYIGQKPVAKTKYYLNPADIKKVEKKIVKVVKTGKPKAIREGSRFYDRPFYVGQKPVYRTKYYLNPADIKKVEKKVVKVVKIEKPKAIRKGSRFYDRPFYVGQKPVYRTKYYLNPADIKKTEVIVKKVNKIVKEKKYVKHNSDYLNPEEMPPIEGIQIILPPKPLRPGSSYYDKPFFAGQKPVAGTNYYLKPKNN